MGKLKHSVNTTCKHISVHVYTFFYDATYDFDLAVNVICIIALYFKNTSIQNLPWPTLITSLDLS